jgi:hypothetical protein
MQGETIAGYIRKIACVKPFRVDREGLRMSISQRAVDYVLGLGPDRVTFAQKHVLLQIAVLYNERYGAANIDLDTLCTGLFRTRGHLVLVFKSLDHILEYKPGLGSGNFSTFRFPELECVKAAERPHKGSIFEVAIRKDLNPDQNQNPPGPPFSKGETLTVRERRRLNDEVHRLMNNHPKMQLEEAIETACVELLIPLDQALAAAEASGLGEALKKRMQRATA